MPIAQLTEIEYLEIEEKAAERSEFFRGEMFAMSGSSIEHVDILFELSRAVGSRLDPRGCQAYGSDLRVKVTTVGLYTYPDLTIVCGKRELLGVGKTATLLNPTVIVEVLSPSTEAYDRGKKFQLYQELESLRQYVLVSQETPLVETFTREASGKWMLTTAKGLGASFRIEPAGIEIPLAEVYRRITFEAATI